MREKIIFYHVVITSLIVLIMTGPGFAQNVPPGEEPGAQEKRFKATVEEKRKELEAKPLKAPAIQVEKREEKPKEGKVFFILKGVKIEGATIFKEVDLRSLYQYYIEKYVTFQEIEEVIEKIKLKYKEKGYVTTTAYLPEQEIKDGLVVIRVIEGKMGELRVEGAKFFKPEVLKKYFHTLKNELLNIEPLGKDILRLNKNPDLEVRTVVSAGSQPETSDITLKVKDQFPYHFGAGADNHGTRLVGKERAILSLRSSNPAGGMGSLFGSILLSKNSNAQSVSYSFPLDTYGTEMGFSYSHFNMQLGEELKPFNITGDSKTLGFFVKKELWLTEAYDGYLNVGLDVKSIKKHNDGVTTSDDQMRIPYIGCDITKNDNWGSSTFSPRFNFGTANFLGASSMDHPTSSRPESGGFFFKFEEELVRYQKMFFESYSVIRIQLQAATHALPSSEQMQLGGSGSVRGYPEGDYLADTAAIMNIDWLFPFYPIPESVKLPYSEMPLRRQVEPVIFLDLGAGRLDNAAPSERREKFLAGVGGGLRVRLYKNLFCRFEWAKDIGAEPVSGAGPSTFHFSIQSEI